MDMEDYLELYDKARKSGLRNFHGSFDGEKRYIPCLDDLLEDQKVVNEQPLGLKEIRLKKIIGTKTKGRSLSFADNFMPILPWKSEFADKWKRLCRIHLQEGIRDPIKVYEYLNRYYVQEGNKRVSVLKFYEAYSIQARVVRVIPEYNSEDPEICIYYDFLDFYEKTQVDYIWMSQGERFNQLYVHIVNYGLVEEGFNDSKLSVHYGQFRKYLYEIGADQLPMTTGDAYLKYLDIYGYEASINGENFENHVRKLYSEFKSMTQGEHEIVFSHQLSGKKSILSGLVGKKTSRDAISVAFIYSSNIKDSSWIAGHDRGREMLELELGQEVETKVYKDVSLEDHEVSACILNAVDEGADLVFVTAPVMLNEAIRAGAERKDACIFVCSDQALSQLVYAYFARMFEVEFLAGMIAGAMTKSNSLGYVIGDPIPSVLASINAFTMGARFVNPYAKVYTGWIRNLNEMMDEQVTEEINRLLELGVDMASLPVTKSTKEEAPTRGLRCMESGSQVAEPVWNWGKFYIKIVEDYKNGVLKAPMKAKGMVSYWWGMDTEIVLLRYSDSIPDDLKETVAFMKKMIMLGHYDLFTGPIRDNKGYLKLEKGEIISVDDILSMNWLVNGVEGDIPVVRVFKENSDLSRQAGVHRSYD